MDEIVRQALDERDLAVLIVDAAERFGRGDQFAIDLLKEHQRRDRFRIEEIDVDSDPALAAEYGATVPVVAVATRCHVHAKMISNIQEVKARGGKVIAVVTDGGEPAEDRHHDGRRPGDQGTDRASRSQITLG